jgi:hypothetical protein
MKGTHGGKGRRSSGRYYEGKTRDWLRKLGFDEVEITGKYRPRKIPGRGLMQIRKDLFGCDCVAVNRERMVWCQSKKGLENIRKAITLWKTFPWCRGVERWLVMWTSGVKEPDLIVVDEKGEVIRTTVEMRGFPEKRGLREVIGGTESTAAGEKRA